jgi:hypothetical protein
MIHEQANALLDPIPKMWTENGKEENQEQIEPPAILNWSNDKEVSTEAHLFITIPFQTHASSFQCLKEPSYVEIFKVSRTECAIIGIGIPRRFFEASYLGFIRWRNIIPEGYHILKKKGWKGLVEHPYEREGAVFFLFYFLHCIFYLFYFCYFISCLSIFIFSVSNNN